MSEKEEELQSLDELAAEGDEMDLMSDDAAFEEIEALRAERDDYRDKFMRALADSENVRKRADRDRREAENYGGSRLARDLLPVYDNMRRALQASDEAEQDVNKALLEGVELTMRELISVFKQHGIDPIIRRCLKHRFPEPRRAKSFRSRLKVSSCMTVCCVLRR